MKCKTWFAVLGILLLFSLVFSIFLDFRWIVVFLLIVCIVTPFLFIFLYIYYGLLPLNAINATHHHVVLNDSSLEVAAVKEVEETKEVAYKLDVEYINIKELITYPKKFILNCEIPKGLVIFDDDCFENPDDYLRAYALIKSKLDNNRNLK